MERTRTNSTTNLRLSWTKTVKSGLILSLASIALFSGLSRGCVRIVSQSQQSTGIADVKEKRSKPLVQHNTVDLGTFRVTAYCACEKCCGKWSLNRPDGVVYGAEGTVLQPGVSCASTLPFGTILEIDDYGVVVVQDRIAKWVTREYGDNCIDIYLDSHDDACSFGLKYMSVKEVTE